MFDDEVLDNKLARDRPTLSEVEVHYARQVAEEVRHDARVATSMSVEHPGWAKHLIFGTAPLKESKIIKEIECGSGITRAEPPNELVRVRFDEDGTLHRPSVLIDAIIADLGPFIIGCGEVRAEKTLEGFKILSLDEGEIACRHDYAPMNDITPEMIVAGVSAFYSLEGVGELTGPFSASDLVFSVYRAMHALAKELPIPLSG